MSDQAADATRPALRAGVDPVRALALWGSTEEVLTHPSAAAHRLSGIEERRAARFADTRDRDSFRAAHLLVRICGERAGLGPGALTVEQRCDECGGDHGRPRFRAAPDVGLSWAHTRGAVVAAVGPAAVGVDIEAAVAVPASSISSVLSSREAAWLAATPEDAVTIWCRKEAAAKAAGVGVAGMAAVDALEEGGWTEVRSDGFQICVFSPRTIDLHRLR